jgi:hypothetical protein
MMRALTLTQPWAGLVAAGIKPCRRCGEVKPADQMLSDKRAGTICKPCRKAERQAWIDKNRDRYDLRRWAHHLEKKYGITLGQYEALLASQDHRCAICGIHFGQKERRLHVDHNHETGVVRGILCFPCNTGIGAFRDSADRLRAAAAYIEKKDGALCVR